MGLAERTQPALDQGRVGQHPAVHGAVVDLQAAFQQQLFDVAVAQRVAQVPRDRLDDQPAIRKPTSSIRLAEDVMTMYTSSLLISFPT